MIYITPKTSDSLKLKGDSYWFSLETVITSIATEMRSVKLEEKLERVAQIVKDLSLFSNERIM
jgi:hypothetical protein